jgi:excisionase family DNA binding protein
MAATAELLDRSPTREEIRSAAEAATALAQACEADGKLIIAGADGRQLHIAPAISGLMVELLGYIARGETVTIVAREAMLTTQEAADILSVSRPFLSGLLKKNAIPFVPVGSHRRIMYDDLMAYKARRDAAREAALDELARLGQEFDAT